MILFMLYSFLSYILGFYSGIFYSKKSVNIKKELDSILNTFLEKTNMNKNEYKTLNDYMDLINSKLDCLTQKLFTTNKNLQNTSSLSEDSIKQD